MSDVVNLNRFRKKKARAEKEKCAEKNRVKYGRNKDEKTLAKAEKQKFDDFLDGRKREDDA